jgi:hypothetical protein
VRPGSGGFRVRAGLVRDVRSGSVFPQGLNTVQGGGRIRGLGIMATSILLIAIRDAAQHPGSARPSGRNLYCHLSVLLFEFAFLISPLKNPSSGNATLVDLAHVNSRVEPGVTNVLDDLSDRFRGPNAVSADGT